ncbi:serine/arginine-rich splicing factor SR45-like [Papaver somniferum]|uniref:serine/arginine-rich splicing factor SR45-like n=1 Tax=Papaver somniferum TaxID=3469 RepID=UPI000E7002C0|nr:serine/arginine-rich splicing factor SR45-like [Papaver somniferum]
MAKMGFQQLIMIQDKGVNSFQIWLDFKLERSLEPVPTTEGIEREDCQIGSKGVLKHQQRCIHSSPSSFGSREVPQVLETSMIHICPLPGNMNEGRLKQIFDTFGEVVSVELPLHLLNRDDAVKARLRMDGEKVDGIVVRVRRVLLPSPPTKVESGSRKRVADAPRGQNNLDSASSSQNPFSPPRRRSRLTLQRGDFSRPRTDTPWRWVDSSPRRRMDSTVGHPGSPPRRIPASFIRRRSPSSPPRLYRSPARASLRRGRRSPVRRLSPIIVRR